MAVGELAGPSLVRGFQGEEELIRLLSRHRITVQFTTIGRDAAAEIVGIGLELDVPTHDTKRSEFEEQEHDV
nr:hypothetical protein [Paracoccus ravus]